MKRRHARLIAFFLLLAFLGTAAGWIALARTAGPPEGSEAEGLRRVDEGAARLALAFAVAFTALAGLVGVYVHRRGVLWQKQVETERYLRRIEREAAKSLALLEGAVDMLLQLDTGTGVVRETNALARERLGLEVPDGPDGPFPSIESVLIEEDRERFGAELARATRDAGSAVDIPELRVLDRDGRAFPAWARIVVVRVDDQEIVELLLRDLGQQKELERRLRLHEQLGSLGLLTASVAHEINNPLEGMANYVHLLEREGLDPENRRRYVGEIRLGIERIGDLARDLLRFSRPVTSSGVADLSRVVEHGIELARYAKHCRELEFTRAGAEAPAWVLGNERPLEQVVVNLLMNAGKAMQGRGAVSLEIRRGQGREPRWELSIADGGPGVGREGAERIFEPLFTTGDGHGLGLSIAQEIVRAHGGSLTVRDREEGGAEFRVSLPAASPPADGRAEGEGAAVGGAEGSRREAARGVG